MTTSMMLSSEQIADQMVTALEGGSNHWLEHFHLINGSPTPVRPWYADPKLWAGDFEIDVCIGGEDEHVTLTPTHILRGQQILLDDYPHRWTEIVEETGDAETADVFLQLCVFGEVVFG